MIEDSNHYCFLKSQDIVKEFIIKFLTIILGKKYSSSIDYDVKIIFQGTDQRSQKDILTHFLQKKDNSVKFLLRK